MNDDQLRARLRRADPVASRPVDPVTSPRAQELLERTVSDTATGTRLDRPAAPRRLVLLGAAAAAALVAGGVVLLGGADPSTAPGGGTLALTTSASDPLTGICARFDASRLAGFPVAFAGTAVEVGDGTATLEVTRWYRGGDASTVTLQGPSSAALTGFEVVEGEEYLVTASDGTVSDCGYSGAATPELEAAYDAAF